MRKYSIIVVVGILILCLAPIDSAFGDPRREKSLYYLAKAKRPIKVYMGKFINSSGSEKIDPENFARVFGQTLEARKDIYIQFKLAENPDEADISISGEIKEYKYSETDPIDMFMSTYTLILDAMSSQNYVGMAVNYTVKDPKTNKVLWSRRLRPSVTKSVMSEDQSTPLIIEKAANQFVSKCFKKPKRR